MNTITTWTHRPKEDWSGPADDAELLEVALKDAHFRYLWMLSGWKISEDFNSRDAAIFSLAKQIAFFTGCDCERSLNILKASKLVKESEEPIPDITLKAVIGNAVKQTHKVYSDVPIPVTQQNLTEAQRIALRPLDTDNKGYIERHLRNVITACANPAICGFHMGLDLFNTRIWFVKNGKTLKEKELYTDNLITDIRDNLIGYGFKSPGKEDVRDAIEKIALENAHDSAQDWLMSLKWDGTERIKNFMRDYMGAEDTEYSQAVSLYLWTALAGRVMDPGCQADIMPIFVGEQGMRKSTTIRCLVPHEEFYSEISFLKDDKEQAYHIVGKLVGEVAELRGLMTRDAESIKAFITRRTEEWRVVYKSQTTKYPRRLLLIGTTNEDQFLGDVTGERRYAPILIKKADTEAVVRDREQLWAEARELVVVTGIQWKKLEECARPEIEKFKIEDDWTGRIDYYAEETAEGATEPRARVGLTIEEIACNALGFKLKEVNRPTSLRIAKILKLLGFKRGKRQDGKQRINCYKRSSQIPLNI